MKIRWTKTGIRFRITPWELAQMEAGERIEEVLSWHNHNAWSAAIEIGETTELSAQGNTVTIKLSHIDRAKLLEPETEGVYFSDENFRYYIEKDFPCAHPRAADANEPTSETFASPPDFEDRKNN